MKSQFLLLPGTFVLTATVHAATLAPETIAAWNDYLRQVDSSLQERARSGKFLWSRENPERDARLRRGEIIVGPAPGQSPRRVPGGLIHHWIGSVFLADTHLNDVLQVMRDYDRYKDYYTPAVIGSKTIARNEAEDQFSVRLINKVFFVKTALDADYESKNVRLDDRRSYCISRSTRVQEVENYGQPGEHRLAEGEGSGYIWKLHGISRLEEVEGGVYFEAEAIVLSRDIPSAVRMFVEPIVRRVSRNSLTTALQQTEMAVRGRTVSKNVAPATGVARKTSNGN